MRQPLHRFGVVWGPPTYIGMGGRWCGMRRSIEERLLSFVREDAASGCWLWTGSLRGKLGYGNIKINGKPRRAHRVSYELFVGPIPDNKPCVMHICDVPSCVNPRHLTVGTIEDNVRDRDAKGRTKSGPHAKCPDISSIAPRVRLLLRYGLRGHDVARALKIPLGSLPAVLRAVRDLEGQVA